MNLQDFRVSKVGNRDSESFYIEVYKGVDFLIAEGHYNHETNMAHLTNECDFLYDTDDLVHAIEEQKIQIT